MKSSVRIALALVVRDEARFLARHLRYHAALGIARSYVFLDDCRDRTPDIARAERDTVVLDRPRRAEERYMSSYQTRCLAEALELARADGCDWLLHVDPDEFVAGERGLPLRRLIAARPEAGRPRGCLRAMLEKVPDDCEQVRMRTFELVPERGLGGADPLREQRHFLWRGTVGRCVLDPRDGSIRAFRGWYGGSKGKSIVRCSAPAVPSSAHAWQRVDGRPLRTLRRGRYYHFVVTSAAHWLDKYRKFSGFPARWEKGDAVGFPKQAWKEAATRMTEAEALRYYEDWVAVDPRRIARWRRLRLVRDDPFVADLLGHTS